MKRNPTMKTLTIGLMAVSAFALSGCIEEDTASTSVFPSLDACLAEAQQQANTMMTSPDGITLTEAMCRESYASAEAVYKDAAPRYDSKALCEEQHGAAACQQEVRADGSSVFLPLLAGYMVGRLTAPGGSAVPTMPSTGLGTPGLGNPSACDPRDRNDPDCRSGVTRGGGSSYVFSPVYRTAGGGYATASGQSLSSNYVAKSTAPLSTFARPTSTIKAAPMTTATVRASGGFGAARASGGGSFGG